MKYAAQYLKTAAAFVEGYDGSVPLQHYLKAKFSAERKYGSKDRKNITHLCYSYFRLGHFLKNINTEDRIRVALFLTSADEWKGIFNEELLALWDRDLEERIAIVEQRFPGNKVADIFPWQEELSDGIDKQRFTLSHLNQPYLFIRIRPGKEITVKNKLTNASILFTQVSPNCISLPNSSKLEDILELNKEYVVQDLNSQRVGEFLKIESVKSKGENEVVCTKVWDCCAASGGKAIMAYDLIPNIQLTVSDVRPTIIHNLKNRFEEANISNYYSFVADLLQHQDSIPNAPFNLIVCDAPCSGSGTWGRTPEQLYFFSTADIKRYSSLQKKITSNVIPFIKPAGYLLYITCSVFKKENEEVVEFIKEQFHLQLIKMELLKGYDKKADTMFAALFTTSPI
jgi:16S rRNA (cytosine967-C5)-methyltransferase